MLQTAVNQLSLYIKKAYYNLITFTSNANSNNIGVLNLKTLTITIKLYPDKARSQGQL